MGASVDGASVHSVVTSCALFGALFVVLSGLSVAILVAVNWRPWRIYRYCPPLQLQQLLIWELAFWNSVLEASPKARRLEVFSCVLLLAGEQRNHKKNSLGLLLWFLRLGMCSVG